MPSDNICTRFRVFRSYFINDPTLPARTRKFIHWGKQSSDIQIFLSLHDFSAAVGFGECAQSSSTLSGRVSILQQHSQQIDSLYIFVELHKSSAKDQASLKSEIEGKRTRRHQIAENQSDHVFRHFRMKTRARYFGGVIVVTPVMVGEVEPASRIRIPRNPGNEVPK